MKNKFAIPNKLRFIFDEEDEMAMFMEGDGEEFIIEGPPGYLPTTLYPIDESVFYPMTFTNSGPAPVTFILLNSNANLTAYQQGVPDGVVVVYGRPNYTYQSLLAQLENKPCRISKIRFDSTITEQLEQDLAVVRSDATGENSNTPESSIFSIFQNQPTINECYCNIIADGNTGIQYTILPRTSVTVRFYPSIEQPLMEKVGNCWQVVKL